MIKSALFSFILMFTISQVSFAQSDDIPLDESLIIKLAGAPTGGYLSKMDLKRAKALEVTERGATILGFQYICDKEGSKINVYNEGAELSDQVRNHLNGLKIGTKVSFENIRIENASGEVLAKPLKLTVKS